MVDEEDEKKEVLLACGCEWVVAVTGVGGVMAVASEKNGRQNEGICDTGTCIPRGWSDMM